MSKTTVKVLVSFCAGQLVQIVCHAVSFNFWQNRQIPFCIAGGFLVAVAIFAGALVNRDTEPKRVKSYMDYATEYTDEQ